MGPDVCLRSDAEIRQTALDVIAWEVSAPFQIEVNVTNGHLRLLGQVHWIYQKQRVQFAVQRLAGITTIDNRITILSAASGCDEENTTAHAFQRLPKLDGRKIHVAIGGGKVILTGTVRSWAEYHQAIQVAWSMSDVIDVENHIVVTASA